MINTNSAFKISQTLRQNNPGADLNNLADKVKNEEGNIPLIVRANDGDEMAAAKDFVSFTGTNSNVDRLDIIDGFATEVSPEQFSKLVKNTPEGITISFNETVNLSDPIELTRPELIDQSPRLLTDNAVKTLGMEKIWEQGYRGQGATIAVIDTGIYPHQDYKDRIVGFKDWINGKQEPYDDQGHGTHVAGDSLGDGKASGGKYTGTAPEANLVGIKVLAKSGGGKQSEIIKGVQWAVDNREKYGINIINMSLGGPGFTSYKDDPIAIAVGKAIDDGIHTLIAGGNSGPGPETIGSPGNHPRAFTVGASDDRGTARKTDDTVAGFSSRGPTKFDGLTKPDILSPGVNITAANAPGSVIDRSPVPHIGNSYITISGTSMATPIMAGIVASMVSANPNVSPDELKSIFMDTADKLEGFDANSQGAGIVDPQEALERVLALKE